MTDKRVVASFHDYAEAQAVVDALSEEHFPVERLAIVGVGLRSHEQITGRHGYLRAAVEGGISGAIIGALLGWLFGVFSLVEPLVAAFSLAAWGLLIGGVLGALIAIASYAATSGRHEFASIETMTAERYEILAETDTADEAARSIHRHRPASVSANQAGATE